MNIVKCRNLHSPSWEVMVHLGLGIQWIHSCFMLFIICHNDCKNSKHVILHSITYTCNYHVLHVTLLYTHREPNCKSQKTGVCVAGEDGKV